MMITRPAPGVVIYTGLDQPDVEVRDPEDPEVWHEGELRMWRQDDVGTWWADVQWRRGPGQGNYLDTFAAADVRRDLSDPRHTVEA